ncbi:hypothetical protein EST38_g9666 [Candolleomyces aberdarensis]|uniref:Uncharacterized protein n=1 Tax=Candolleomyces aberdarensis TaxID=2316362 RepID=A0A4Q2D9D0_9AGAR|nr:hypothetical protein EST38_g9666 [Candolleomyces aberdarensis]
MAPKATSSTPKTPLVSIPRNLRTRPAPPPTQPKPVRRTPAQVQEEKAREKATKRNEVKIQQAAIVQAAENESRQLEKQRNDDLVANNPGADSESTPVRKVARPRPQPSANLEDPMDIDEPKLQVEREEHISEYEADQASSDSSEDFQPEKRRGKGQSRQVIDELKQYSIEPSTPTPLSKSKRNRSESDTSRVPTAKKQKGKKRPPVPSGLREGWEAQAASRTSNGHAQIRDNDAKSQPPPTTSPSDDQEQESEVIGGISDNEADESKERAQISSSARPARFHFVSKQGSSALVVVASSKPSGHAAVAETTSVPEFITPAVATSIVTARIVKKSDIKLTDIPQDMAVLFNQIFLPRVYQFIAHSSKPWDPAKDSDIEEIFKETFPECKSLSDDPTMKAIISKLTANSVSNLRNKFATQALRTLENVVLRSLPDVEGFNRHDIYKEWVNWSLTGSVHDQVFYYQTYEELDDENDVAVAEPAKKVYRGCKRALSFYETGSKLIPPGIQGHFSKYNWADREEQREGKRFTIKTTSSLIKVARKLNLPEKRDLKEKIVAAARAECKSRSGCYGYSHDNIGEAEGDDSDSDFDLMDDDA